MVDTDFAVAFLLILIGGAAVYLFSAYVSYRIGVKFKIGTFGEYCIPVYNVVLLCQCAAISPWNLLWLLVPVANVGFAVYLWGTLARRLGHDFWLYGVGIFLFGIPILILAFDDSQPADPPSTAPVAGPSIYCIEGEFAGNKLALGSEGVIIGRSTERANLVLASLEVSSMHARVWADRSGGVWVQDMGSSNGTFFSKSDPSGQPPEWVEVKGPTLLPSGTHFRIGDSAAEFVVP
jgi:hypothetical protein